MQPQAQPYPHPHQPHPGNPQPQPQGYPQQGLTVAAPITGGQYEFGDAENRIITKTYTRVRVQAIMLMVVGAGQVLLGFAGTSILGTIGLLGGVVNVVVGAVLLGAAAAFERVVKSRGNDITHMMEALDKLATASGISIVVAAVAFAAGLVLGALAML